MATFGSTPGIQLNTQTGTAGGVTVGREQYTILLGAGDNNAGSASTNTVVDIESRSDAEGKFGVATDLSEGYKRARSGGANASFMRAIMADTTQTSETFAASSTGTLTHDFVVTDTDRITATDTVNSNDFDVNLVYESTVSSPSSGDVLNLNPYNQSWATSSSTDVDITYEYADYSSAVDVLDDALNEGESGIVAPLTADNSIVSTVQAKIETEQNGIREDYKMALALFPVKPNKTSPDGEALYDTPTYSNSYDSDVTFLTAPTAIDGGSTREPLFGIGNFPYFVGYLAGAKVDEPVYNDIIANAEPLAQSLDPADVTNLRNEGVIPLRDRGSVRIKDNQSTYDQEANGGWERDYFTRRVVDLVIASVNEVSELALGGIQDQETREDLAEDIVLLFDTFTQDLGLLQPGQQSVRVYNKSDETIGVDIAIAPLGVTKAIEETLTIEP